MIVAAVAFIILFWTPLATLLRDWWHDPEAGHGLLLGPLSLWFMWRRRIVAGAAPQVVLGLVVLVGAVLLRYAAGLAAELFTLRLSLWLAIVGLTVFVWGIRQVLHWWLPLTLLALSLPLPALVIGALSYPLQLQASEIGAAMLAWRHVPVHLSGNIIALPGQSLFVTEACSGLRSLTALLALGVLISGLWLRRPWVRAILVIAAIPVAILINGVRVFLTGFLVYFVDPALGQGFMHLSEGFAMFGVAFAILAALAWLLSSGEGLMDRRRRT
ncbi:MAG TPA: exosortase/archaeosortase family protein [Longimicrobiales bacterium]|nr:exosortase/archaeosortase family protein [Longimicrobiales bacterium]